MPESFTITDLASEFAITPRTLRFYEDKGLLRPVRQGNARIYGRRDRARLRLILRGKRLGFSLAEIQEMLDLYDVGDGQVTQLRTLLTKSRERLAAMRDQRRDIDEATHAGREESMLWIQEIDPADIADPVLQDGHEATRSEVVPAGEVRKIHDAQASASRSTGHLEGVDS